MLSFLFILLFAFIAGSVQSDVNYDVVIYGATPAGIAAALSAASFSSSLYVLLLEPNSFIGGMSANGGIGLRDIGNESSIINTTMWKWGKRNSEHYNTKELIFQADSYVMTQTALDMLSEYPNIALKLNTNLSYIDPVIKAGTTIKAINTLTNGSSPEQYYAKVFIDCTYDGDLVKFSGATYTFGRESTSQYNESLAGVQAYTTFANFVPGFPVLATEDANSSELIPYVDPMPLGPVGSADQRIMSFAYRPCVTTNKTLQIPFYAPPNYNRSDFLVLQRYLESLVDSKVRPNGPEFYDFYYVGGYSGFPNQGKNDMCGSFELAYTSDDPTDVYRYVEADYNERQAIIEKVKYIIQGQLYYLANDPLVPSTTRNSFSSYGYCNDQWKETGNFPPQVYVRTGLRVVGDVVMTQNEIVAGQRVEDSIALGSWKYDMHVVSRTAVKNSTDGQLYVNNEGAMFTDVKSKKGITYEVPVTVLFPKREEVTNFIVPVCMSASHVAFTSLRIEPMYSFLGDSAGIVAALAVIESNNNNQIVVVQDINVTDVQTTLSSRGILFHVDY